MKTNRIELRGDVIESFERVERIVSIILLGEDGGIRKIDIKSPYDQGKEAIKRLKRRIK